MEPSGTLDALLESYERSLLEPSIRKSDLVSQLLADSFVEFGSSGHIYTKAQIITSLQAEAPRKISASQFKVHRLAANVALITYRTSRHTSPPVHALRSSVWLQQGGKWQMVFHQGTLTQSQT